MKLKLMLAIIMLTGCGSAPKKVEYCTLEKLQARINEYDSFKLTGPEVQSLVSAELTLCLMQEINSRIESRRK